MRIVPVLSQHVDEHWPRVERFIIDACRRGPLDADASALKEGCKSRHNQLWIAETEAGEARCAVVTGVHDGVCVWEAAGGVDMASWGHFQTIIEQWARENGCSRMRSFSRRGMVKRLPEYKVRGVILEKVI